MCFESQLSQTCQKRAPFYQPQRSTPLLGRCLKHQHFSCPVRGSYLQRDLHYPSNIQLFTYFKFQNPFGRSTLRNGTVTRLRKCAHPAKGNPARSARMTAITERLGCGYGGGCAGGGEATPSICVLAQSLICRCYER